MGKEDHYGRCHICGKEGNLTFEHIPPKKALNQERARVYDGIAMLKKYHGENVRYKAIQQGMGKYTLCEQCNNDTGAWYADEYCKIANSVAFVLHNHEPLSHGSSIRLKLLDIYVLRFVKQVIAMVCSLLPFEDVERLGFNRLLLCKECNKANTDLFDLRMYLTSMKTGQIHSGETLTLIKNQWDGIDGVVTVDFTAYPFGFILNLSPEIELKYGTSIKGFLGASYDEKYDMEMSLMYIERVNEDKPVPMSFKPV